MHYSIESPGIAAHCQGSVGNIIHYHLKALCGSTSAMNISSSLRTASGDSFSYWSDTVFDIYFNRICAENRAPYPYSSILYVTLGASISLIDSIHWR